MNRRTMPFIWMLVAGVFTCIMTFINEYSIVDKLLILSIVMLIFYMLGTAMRKALDSFDRQNEEKARAEEEAREKALREQEEKEALQKQQETGEGEKKVG